MLYLSPDTRAALAAAAFARLVSSSSVMILIRPARVGTPPPAANAHVSDCAKPKTAAAARSATPQISVDCVRVMMFPFLMVMIGT